MFSVDLDEEKYREVVKGSNSGRWKLGRVRNEAGKLVEQNCPVFSLQSGRYRSPPHTIGYSICLKARTAVCTRRIHQGNWMRPLHNSGAPGGLLELCRRASLASWTLLFRDFSYFSVPLSHNWPKATQWSRTESPKKVCRRSSFSTF